MAGSGPDNRMKDEGKGEEGILPQLFCRQLLGIEGAFPLQLCRLSLTFQTWRHGKDKAALKRLEIFLIFYHSSLQSLMF